MNWAELTSDLHTRIRQNRPLIHNITNFVVMNSTANIILSCGASPIMAHAPEELEDILGIADVLVLNIGTLDETWIQSILKAGKIANSRNIPVIFDPVGSGASRYRTRTAQRIVQEIHCSIIRGNAAEMMSLCGMTPKIQGVDSLADTGEVFLQAGELASGLKAVVAMTGSSDIVTDGLRSLRINGGNELFKYVTGTGCAVSSVCGCFAAVEKDMFCAAACALNLFKIAGTLAAHDAPGPGTFSKNLSDVLYRMGPSDIACLTNIEGKW